MPTISRELEARLEKQKATRKFIDEFMQKREEVKLGLLHLSTYRKAACHSLPTVKPLFELIDN